MVKTGRWHYFGFSEESDLDGSSLQLIFNDKRTPKQDFESVVIGPPQGRVFIGSYEGILQFFEGFIWSFNYFTSAEVESGVLTTCEGCSVCPVDHGEACLSLCNINEFPQGRFCYECDPKCTKGCRTTSECIHSSQHCHESCKTCKGPGRN
jgi:hypothetical protein